MIISEVLSAIDEEIEKLQQVRQLLSDSEAAVSPETRNLEETIPAKRRGRPPGKVNAETKLVAKRIMSEEGRARIAAAQKKRWASSKKTAKVSAQPVTAKKVSGPNKKTPIKPAVVSTKKLPSKVARAKKPIVKNATAKKSPILSKKIESAPISTPEVAATGNTEV